MGERFENSVELFGGGCGSGCYAEIECGICHKVYNDGCDEGNLSDESVTYIDFAGITVCECCFGKIESSVLQRINDLLPWIARIIAKRRKRTQQMEDLVKDVLKELGQ